MRAILSLIGVLLAVAGVLWWQQQQAVSAPVQAPTAAVGARMEAPAPAVTGASPDRPADAQETAVDATVAPTVAKESHPQVNPAAATDPVRIDLTRQIWSLREEAHSWTPAIFRAIVDSAEPLDPEQAYLAYEYLKSCLGAPRTLAEVDRQLENYEQAHRRDPESFDLNMLDQALSSMQRTQDRCLGLDADLTGAAYNALEISADSGFMPAVVEYLTDGASLLLRDQTWLFAHPDHAARFRLRAHSYAAQALAANEAEAILAYGRFLFNGIVAPPRRAEGYAYASVAARIDPHERNLDQGILEMMRREMSRSELDEAEAMAARLCERYCE